MAKAKKAYQPTETKGKRDAIHKPNAADLKYIGSAFDRAIESLLEIKVHAKDPAKVEARIGRLNELKAKVRLECPQNWFDPYELN